MMNYLKVLLGFKVINYYKVLIKPIFIILYPKRKSLQTKIPNIRINDIEILQQTVTKFLGIIIDQNLN